MKIPNWAQELTLKTLIQFQCDDVPTLNFRRCNSPHSSGSCNWVKRTIAINQGRSRRDAALVLLHELTHWICPKIHKTYGHGQYAREFEVCEGHTDRFWMLAWRIYQWAGLPLRYCYRRESGYKKGAIKAFKALKSQKLKEK